MFYLLVHLFDISLSTRQPEVNLLMHIKFS